LAPDARRLVTALTFGQARRNFYEAARRGLDAELLWPATTPPSPRPVRAAVLVRELLPIARSALVAAGLDADEVGALLDVVAERVRTGGTGARWQRATLARLEGGLDRERALQQLVERYLAHAASGRPAHEWQVDA
jgi:hypothetical protein